MSQLPPDVVDALRRGEPLEAMKRLREAASLSLKDAKKAIEAASGKPEQKSSLQDFFREQAAKAARATKADARPTAPAARPLARPDPMRVPQPGDLSPGEVPRRGGTWAIVVIGAALLYAWVRLRG